MFIVRRTKPAISSDDIIEEIEEEKNICDEDVKESIRKKLQRSSEKPLQKKQDELDNRQPKRFEGVIECIRLICGEL